jgi:hypothetical protein
MESVEPPLRPITYPSTSDLRDYSDPTPLSRPAEDGSCTVCPMSIRVFVRARPEVLDGSATPARAALPLRIFPEVYIR